MLKSVATKSHGEPLHKPFGHRPTCLPGRVVSCTTILYRGGVITLTLKLAPVWSRIILRRSGKNPCTHVPPTVLMSLKRHPSCVISSIPERQQGALSWHVNGSSVITPTLYVRFWCCASVSIRNVVTPSTMRTDSPYPISFMSKTPLSLESVSERGAKRET